jgi:flagellar basal-body rod protein FlgF
VPPDAQDIAVGRDGTLSADGVPVAQLGLVMPANPNSLTRVSGTRFAFDGDAVPVATPQVLQGFLEGSNVNPMTEMTRLIEVQRAYERGSRMMNTEDERIKTVIQTLGR